MQNKKHKCKKNNSVILFYKFLILFLIIHHQKNAILVLKSFVIYSLIQSKFKSFQKEIENHIKYIINKK